MLAVHEKRNIGLLGEKEQKYFLNEKKKLSQNKYRNFWENKHIVPCPKLYYKLCFLFSVGPERKCCLKELFATNYDFT